MSQPGHVYVLLEPLNPNMVKIGFTRSATSRRVKALHGTGRAVPLIVLWDEYVSDPGHVESTLHERFADSRVNRGREFFYVTPKAAVAALMEVAAPYRLEPFHVDGRVEILADLRERFGDIFRDDLISVELIVTHEGVFLVTSSRTAARDTVIVRSNLDFIYAGDEPVFSQQLTAEGNMQRLLELKELTLIMTTDLVAEEHAHRIDREQNPYWTATWFDHDGADQDYSLPF